MQTIRQYLIAEGVEVTCDTLTWKEPGWEFDYPSLMLSPVIRTHESGMGHYHIREGVLISAVCEHSLKDHEWNWEWRGYKIESLKRRFREALAGKPGGTLCYSAERVRVRFVKDKRGKLTWEEITAPSGKITQPARNLIKAL